MVKMLNIIFVQFILNLILSISHHCLLFELLINAFHRIKNSISFIASSILSRVPTSEYALPIFLRRPKRKFLSVWQ